MATRPAHEKVEGWATGEMPPLAPVPESPEGWDEDSLSELGDQGSLPVEESTTDAETHYVRNADTAAAALGFGDDQAVSDFFSRSEEEMLQSDREARRAERDTGSSMRKRIITGAVVVGVIAALIVAGYAAGLGWPTQKATVNGMFVAYSAGEPVDEYWVAVPDRDVAREMAKVPPVESFTIDSIDRNSQTSTAQVTVVPKEGAEMKYTVTMAREGVGWRVTGIDYSWSSTGG